MSIIADLQSRPPVLTSASRYVAVNGIFYMLCGASLLAWPGMVQTIFMDPPFIGHDELLVRLVGLLLAVIGWLCLFGGRSGGRQFVAATVVDRILFVPAPLAALAMTGLAPHILLTFAVLDPLLAIGAWILLSRDSKGQIAFRPN